jgi:hypothetical protein
MKMMTHKFAIVYSFFSNRLINNSPKPWLTKTTTILRRSLSSWRSLMEEILPDLEGEQCFAYQEGNGDCVRDRVASLGNRSHCPPGIVHDNGKENNARARYAMYRHYVASIEGYLGKSKRIRLPTCVKI